MNSIVKHIITLMSGVALLTACSDTNALEEPERPQNARAISFSGYYGWPAAGSRADASSLFAKDDEIIVYATHTDDKTDDSFTSNFMKKQIVKFDGNVWSYSPIKYWPMSGKVTFRGYYPATVKFDEKNYPNNGMIATAHRCETGFEPLYGVEAVVNIDNGKLDGAVTDDGKLQLAFTPLLNKVNFLAKVDDGLFDDGNVDDEYRECRFLLLSFKLWGFSAKADFRMREDTWTSDRSLIYYKNRPLDLTDALDKRKVEDVVPGYKYNPAQGYCTDSAVVVHEGDNLLNIFNKSLHLIPRDTRLSTNKAIKPGFEITYVVLTNKVDADGNKVYKESGIITREISLTEIFDDSGIESTKVHNYHLIKKLININLDFSIDAVTVTRNLVDYTYKPMF
jgi:hypothetical protein